MSTTAENSWKSVLENMMSQKMRQLIPFPIQEVKSERKDFSSNLEVGMLAAWSATDAKTEVV
jgi:hypothetical protein